MTDAAELTWDTVPPDMPLLLEDAARLFAPRGMTAYGLRAEARRKNLVIRRIAGKYWTTKNDLLAMVNGCPVVDAARASGNGQPAMMPPGAYPAPATGSSSTDDTRKALDAALTIVQGLKRRSPITSPASRSPAQHKAHASPIRSRSRTS